MITYYFVYKFDIFKARTGALVNVREALAPGDNAAAQQETGKVEAKLVERKVRRGGRGLVGGCGALGELSPMSLVAP